MNAVNEQGSGWDRGELSMKVAYGYCQPLLAPPVAQAAWPASVEQIYQDWAGEGGDDRPELTRLLQDCDRALITGVYIQHWADLGATAETAIATLTHLHTLGITVESLTEGPLVTPDWATLALQIQDHHRREHLRLGHARNRVQSLPPPGRAPYGYRRGRDRYLLDRSTAPVVQAFFEQFLLFGSLRGAVRHLGRTYGKRIAPSTGQRWLTHPVYRGDLGTPDGPVVRNTHVAILGREEAAQVDRILRRNQRLPPRTASAQRSLAGLVVCQDCQQRLQVATVTRPRRAQCYQYLRSPHCPRDPHCSALSYDAVLAATITAVCEGLAPALTQQPLPPVAALQRQIQAQIQIQSQHLAQLAPLVASGLLDQTTADLRAYALRQGLAELEQQRSQLPPANLTDIAKTLSIPQFWQDLSEAERRVYLREFIRQIDLHREGDQWAIAIQFVFGSPPPTP